MAASVIETKVVKLGGNTPGLVRVYGNATATSVTEFILKPGSNDTNVSGSAGLREILNWGLECSSGEQAAKSVKTYDATQDGHIITCTCQANATYNWWVEGVDNGE